MWPSQSIWTLSAILGLDVNFFFSGHWFLFSKYVVIHIADWGFLNRPILLGYLAKKKQISKVVKNGHNFSWKYQWRAGINEVVRDLAYHVIGKRLENSSFGHTNLYPRSPYQNLVIGIESNKNCKLLSFDIEKILNVLFEWCLFNYIQFF